MREAIKSINSKSLGGIPLYVTGLMLALIGWFIGYYVRVDPDSRRLYVRRKSEANWTPGRVSEKEAA